ncbi:MAG: hypothetical protein AABX75_01595 [Nanoarchaeota archaeon]
MQSRVYTINIFCRKCRTHLYKYRKEGEGHLMKCYKSNIIEDHTRGDLKCHGCGQEFAREGMVHNRPAHKVIQGKVYVKG